MKNWILAGVVVAVLGFFVAETPAQEPLKAPGTTITKTELQPAPMVRTGLFRRLGERRGVTTTIVPATTPSTTTKVEPVPPTTTVPMTSSRIETRTGLFSRLRSRVGR